MAFFGSTISTEAYTPYRIKVVVFSKERIYLITQLIKIGSTYLYLAGELRETLKLFLCLCDPKNRFRKQKPNNTNFDFHMKSLAFWYRELDLNFSDQTRS